MQTPSFVTPSRRVTMRRRLLYITSLAALAACGGSAGGDGGGVVPPTQPTPTVPTATTAVAMRGSAFVPPAILVASGATVTFTNEDGINHNVIFDAAGVGTIPNFSGGTRSITMPAATGTYTYHCSLHGGMSGSVKVE